MIDMDQTKHLSPTVTQVIEEFVTRMHADDGIGDDAIGRLENLLRQGAVLKSDDIRVALFDTTPEGER
jgi:hypothetical protein